MLYIFLFFIGFIAVFVLTLRFATMLMAKTVGKQIDEKYEAARIITSTGRAPKNWTDRLEKRVSSKGGSPKVREQAKKKVLKRIDNLIMFFKKSPLIDVEAREMRNTLLNELQEIRGFWEGKEWKEIISA